MRSFFTFVAMVAYAISRGFSMRRKPTERRTP